MFFEMLYHLLVYHSLIKTNNTKNSKMITQQRTNLKADVGLSSVDVTPIDKTIN